MRSSRSCCAKPRPCSESARLRKIAPRLFLLALAAALVCGSGECSRSQAQQPANPSASTAAKQTSDQPASGQANPGPSGTQNSQPQQDSGSSAGAPMVLGEGDGEIAPVEPAAAQTPMQPAPSQSGQQDTRPSAQQQALPAAPDDATNPEPAPASLAELPPGPPDSTDPRKLVDWECADLLKLATDLKTAVDKTTKDELSLSVVRKAGEIEQVAHKLRDDMRPAMANKN